MLQPFTAITAIWYIEVITHEAVSTFTVPIFEISTPIGVQLLG